MAKIGFLVTSARSPEVHLGSVIADIEEMKILVRLEMVWQEDLSQMVVGLNHGGGKVFLQNFWLSVVVWSSFCGIYLSKVRV